MVEVIELTRAQMKLLIELREHGEVFDEGYRKSTIEALQHFDLVSWHDGGSIRLSSVGRRAELLPGNRVKLWKAW